MCLSGVLPPPPQHQDLRTAAAVMAPSWPLTSGKFENGDHLSRCSSFLLPPSSSFLPSPSFFSVFSVFSVSSTYPAMAKKHNLQRQKREHEMNVSSPLPVPRTRHQPGVSFFTSLGLGAVSLSSPPVGAGSAGAREAGEAPHTGSWNPSSRAVHHVSVPASFSGRPHLNGGVSSVATPCVDAFTLVPLRRVAPKLSPVAPTATNEAGEQGGR